MLYQFPEHYHHLDSCLESAVQLLKKGMDNRHHGFHSPTLITSIDNAANARVMVLRDWQIASRTLLFFSDYRSEKINEIQSNNQVVVLPYALTSSCV